MTRFRSVLVAPLAALLVLTPVSAYAAAGWPAEGSVPSEVAAYVADGSLVAELNDVYGPSAAGDGIDFDDTTKAGAIERVHVWSAEELSGEETEHPLDLLNEWIVPMSIAEEPVGLATIWINPATDGPELASFVADPDLATALSEVEAGSSLVHDVPSAAWLALAADGTLTPLVPGTTGLSTPVPLDDVALLPPPSAPPVAGGDPGTGVGLAIAVLLFLLAVIVVVLLVPALRKKRPVEAVEEGEPAELAELEEAVTEPEEVVAEPEEVVAEPEEVAAEPVEAPAKKPRKPKKPPQGDA